MNEMDYNNSDYRDYRNYRDDGNYRDYREDYRYNYRDDEDYRDYRDYRENYRDDYRTRDYDRRGGKTNRRSYRNYRGGDYREELHMVMEDLREGYRKIEDIAEMAENPQDKNMLTKIAQKEKENYGYLKQIVEK